VFLCGSNLPPILLTGLLLFLALPLVSRESGDDDHQRVAAPQQLKRLHPNLRVLISLAGAPGFSAAASTVAGREAFVASCINLFINGNLGAGVSAAGV
jgi:hypothetical protein